MKNAMAAWACVALLAGASAAPAQDRTDAYRIEPGDQLAVSVLEDPGLNTTVLVRPDGRIALPLAGTLMAEGRSPEDLQAAIRRALAKVFISPPSVTVSLVAVAAPQDRPAFYVLGQAGRPGRYDLDPDRPIDVLQALALVGGPGVFAATDRIQVRRRVDGRDTMTLFNYEVVEEGLVPADRFTVQDGDIIFIPQRGLFE